MSKAFFDSLRAALGTLAQNQVDGINHLLQAIENLPLRHRAYVLATVHHETGPISSILHWTPRREIWGPTDAQRRYEGRADLGNTVLGDGKRFMGRGYVQLTGRANYRKASLLIGRDLVMSPDLALNPDIAARVIVAGMRDGWFTGKRMADYTTFKSMRAVVNGADKADLIAGYAEKFERALQAAPVAATTPSPAPTIVPTADSPPAATPAAPRATLQNVMAVIAGLIAAAVAAIFALHK